jgi:DNA-directed RNA polymerase subunit RPC12/RpoP
VRRNPAEEVDSMQDYGSFNDDDDKGSKSKSGKGHKEWDCPTCYANNPTDEGITDGDEMRCNYCGNEFKVSFTDSGKMRFKEI